MKHLIMISIVLACISCSKQESARDTRSMVVGSWTLAEIKANDLPRIKAEELMNGGCDFRNDGSYHGWFEWTKVPKGTPIPPPTHLEGTWTVSNQTLTCTFSTNHPPVKSKISFEDGIMILVPELDNQMIHYYKRDQ